MWGWALVGSDAINREIVSELSSTVGPPDNIVENYLYWRRPNTSVVRSVLSVEVV